MFLPGQCYQFIHISCCGMHAFRSQGIHDSSHFVYRDAAHGCRISFQQDIEQAYCRVKFEVFPFLRQSETMEMPAGSEIDASIIYADYYYMEALLRLKRLTENKPVIDE